MDESRREAETSDQAAPERPADPPTRSHTRVDGRRSPATLLGRIFRRGRTDAADYGFEIVILVIGVFLGITFEGFASDWDRTRDARSSLRYLVADLERDEADMDRIIEAQRGQERDFAEIADWLARDDVVESPRVDSLLEKVLTSLTVFPRRGAYSSMISSGQVGLLPPELANQIVNLYENVYTRLAANGEHFDYSLERDFFPAYAGVWDPVAQALLVRDPVDRLRFRNMLSLMRSWSVYYVDLVRGSRAEVQALRSAIDVSLGDGG